MDAPLQPDESQTETTQVLLTSPLPDTLSEPAVIQARTTPLQHVLFVFDNYIRYILSKTLVILLTFFSFYVIWEVVLFVIFEYPEVQHRFAEHTISQAEVDHLIATAVISTGATIAGAVLAIRLNSVQEKITHTIDIILATALMLFQGHVREYILTLEVVKNWSQYLSF
jgi:cytochrome c oxidase assembly factor CtaG